MIGKNKKIMFVMLITAFSILISISACTSREENPADTQTVEPDAIVDLTKEPAATGTQTEIDQKIEAGLADPDPIVKWAWGIIREDIEYKDSGGTIFTDAELLRLELTDSFDDILEGVIIEAYAFEYRLKPKDSSNIPLPGAMYIDDDGWLADGSLLYLYAENNDGEITYITSAYPFREGLGVRNSIIEYFELLPKSQNEWLEQNAEAGFPVPDPVVEAAWEIIRSDIEEKERLSDINYVDQGGGTVITDTEICRFECADRFDDMLEGAVVEVYILEYRLKPEDPSKIVLADGLEIDNEGWIRDVGIAYLMAENIDGEIAYQGMIRPTINTIKRQGLRNSVLEYYYYLDPSLVDGPFEPETYP